MIEAVLHEGITTMADGKVKIYCDSKSGRFVSKVKVKAQPATTETETRRKKKPR